MKPVLLVVAGPNGAGKTTLTERLRHDRWSEGVEYLNPDEVARDRFGDWNEPQAVLDAARAGIAFETVMSTDDKVDFLARARNDGYFIRVFYVSTADPRINASRVAGRVMRGGHTVPIEKILSRYERSMANLAAAIALADRVYIYDNSVEETEATLCARTENGQLRKVYVELPSWVEASVSALERHPAFTKVA